MSLTFRQGTKLILDDGTDRYVFLVSTASASQTFIESSRKVKTIHNPNLVAHTFTDEKSPANLSFDIYFGPGNVESSILEWFGFTQDFAKYRLNPSLTLGEEPKKYDVYIDAGNTVYKLADCVGQNISFLLDRKNPLTLKITGIAPNLEVASLPSGGTWHYQDPTTFYNAPVTLDGYSNIVAVTCEFTRSISWIKNKSTHNIGSIYTVDTPILRDMSVSGTITRNKINDANSYNDSTSVVIRYGPAFKINLDTCNTTDRWDMGDIHKVITDYKMLPEAVDTYITF